jgi:hypothetical protein
MPALHIISKEDSLDPEKLARERARATSLGKKLVVESAGATPNSGLTEDEMIRNPGAAITAGHEEEGA